MILSFAKRWAGPLAAVALIAAPLGSARGEAPPAPAAAATQPASALVPAPTPKPDPLAPDAVPPELEAEGGSLLWQLVRMFIALGIVVVVIYIALNYGLRRLLGLRAGPLGRLGVVQVMERIPLDQKRALFLVKAAGDYLLLGGGEAGLSLISKLDAESVEKLRAEARAAPTQMSPFLQKLLSRRGGAP